MKSLKGIQLGNYLGYSGKIVKVNGLTRKKIGFLRENGKTETYAYLRDLSELPILEEHLEWLRLRGDLEWTRLEGSRFCIAPSGTSNIYILKYYHELQNILELHDIKLETYGES